MQPIQFSTPTISPFLSHVGQMIDAKNKTSEKLEISAKKQDDLIPSNKDIVLYEFFLENFYFSNSDMQYLILNQFKSDFKKWLFTKMYCKNEAVDQYSALALKEKNVKYWLGNPSKILLERTFDDLTSKCNQKEIKEILNHYRPEVEIVSKSKSTCSRFLETAIKVGGFAVQGAGFIVGVYAFFKVWYGVPRIIKTYQTPVIHKIMVQAINNIHPKVFSVGSKIYDMRWRISIGSFIIGCTGLKKYRIIRYPLAILSNLAWLPVTISAKIIAFPGQLAWELAKRSYHFVTSNTHLMGTCMRDKSTFMESIRITHELGVAREFFVSQVMNIKVEPKTT